jgi:hypothetical protein
MWFYFVRLLISILLLMLLYAHCRESSRLRQEGQVTEARHQAYQNLS